MTEELGLVLAQMEDRTNQTWAGKRKRWAALVRAQDAEIQRLHAALARANENHERFERGWYLRGDALEFAEYLAKQAEYLLTALEYEDMARVAWDESGAGTPEFERWGNATDSRGEHAKKLRERIYEFRKRVPRDPHYPCRSDGRCQYAIDHGAEDMGHCPAGTCAMPEGA